MGVTVTQARSVKPARLGHWINGEASADGSGSVPVHDPATGELVAETAVAAPETAAAAVAAAKAAFGAWRDLPALQRARVLFEFKQLLETHRDELARLITREHGKVLSDAHGEVQRGVEVVEFACGAPEHLKGGYVDNIGGGIDNWSLRQPLGVCVGITPFNFPCMVPLWMFPLAIACGNTFVLKPSERDPSPSLLLADLMTRAGAPPGVLNVIQGQGETVRALLDNPDVAAVSFVGSTPVARAVYRQATENGKRVQALAGAKNHLVVAPDADLDLAADALTGAAFGSAGERCMAISVVVAVGDVADPLVDAIEQRLPKIKVGPGNEEGSEMGPLITREHRDKVASYLDSGPSQGATLRVDGRQHVLYSESEGFFLGVSLLDNVTPEMECYRNEIFGPVLEVVRTHDYPEALKIVNDNQYGNGTAIFTRDGGAARQYQFDVNVGMVGINVPIPVPVAYYSFGGWKSSLFGDLNMYGPEGIQFYTRAKVVTARWPDPGTSKVDLGFPRTR
jgi:malonate-semialdehyde dehydrogenase (acetylating)/methylmalonate-semialdehyde dehydrogenase